MHRVSLLTVAVATLGCGRVSFEPVSDAATGTDAASETDAGAGTAIQFIQAATADNGNFMFAPVTFDQDVQAGDLLVVEYNAYLGTPRPSQLVDSLGNTYVVVTENSDYADVVQGLAYTVASTSGPDTITPQFPSTPYTSQIRAHEYAGLTAAPFDVAVGASGSALGPNAAVSPVVTTSFDHALIFGACIFYSAGGTAGDGFNVRTTLTGDVTEDIIATTAGDQQIACTMTSGMGWIAQVATFRGL